MKKLSAVLFLTTDEHKMVDIDVLLISEKQFSRSQDQLEAT